MQVKPAQEFFVGYTTVWTFRNSKDASEKSLLPSPTVLRKKSPQIRHFI
jgi:hypothetical protein